MKDLLLSVETHDLVIEGFDLGFATEIDHVRQHIKTRLLFIYEEWFLDSVQGVKYYELITVKNPNLPLIDSLLKATIRETPDVNEILEYTSSFDRAARRLTVSFKVDTTYGPISISEAVP